MIYFRPQDIIELALLGVVILVLLIMFISAGIKRVTRRCRRWRARTR